MQKRVFIIHGWDGHPDNAWFPWLKKELESKNFEVHIPQMPDTEAPEINAWVSYLKKVVGISDGDTYFVGHSIGCQTILRYFETLQEKERAGGAVFVAGFFTLTGIDTKEEKEIAKPWLEQKIDFGRIKRLGANFIAIFSDNDPFVPSENVELFKKNLEAKTIVEHEKGHFDDETGITGLPSALNALLDIAGLT